MKRKSFLANLSIGVLLMLALISLPTTSALVDANASPAPDVETTSQVINIPTQTCTSSGQTCSPVFSTTVNILDGPIDVQFTPSPLHCSSVAASITVDNGAAQQTVFLAAGVTSAVLSFGNFTAGQHTIRVQALGQTGGCNMGALLNWMGSITVTANFPASPYNECLQDDANPNLVLFNATTGAWQFTNCQGVVQSGVGTVVTKGVTISISQTTPSFRFLLKLDRSTRRGTSSLQLATPLKEYLIGDTNYTNNSCVCGGSH
jgi:hypothetical protein